jgi:hypothetical protein
LKDLGFFLEDFLKIIFLHGEIFEFKKKGFFSPPHPQFCEVGGLANHSQEDLAKFG